MVLRNVICDDVSYVTKRCNICNTVYLMNPMTEWTHRHLKEKWKK